MFFRYFTMLIMNNFQEMTCKFALQHLPFFICAIQTHLHHAFENCLSGKYQFKWLRYNRSYKNFMLAHPHYFSTSLSLVQMVNSMDQKEHFLNDSKSVSLRLNYLLHAPCLQINSNLYYSSWMDVVDSHQETEKQCEFISTDSLSNAPKYLEVCAA